jgi:steroid 5-alpha reductase family enzyme
MSLSMLQQAGVIGLASVVVMALLWALQIRTRDAGVVDAGWAGMLGLAAVFCAATGEGDGARRVMIGAMGGVWGLRLALHLLLDRVLKGEEDGRYQMMRERFGGRINGVLFLFFQAQAVLVVVLAAPFLLASSAAAPVGALDIAAAALWLVGFAGEAAADRQLARFKADPSSRGRVCTAGLWRYSRHPNYFFEWLMWCAYALVALAHPVGWAALSAPALMLLFVLKLTGIPPTEARAVRSRGEAYRRYQRTTSAFFPWFPRKERA